MVWGFKRKGEEKEKKEEEREKEGKVVWKGTLDYGAKYLRS